MMAIYTVVLNDGTVGEFDDSTLDGQHADAFIGEVVNVHLHDENGNPIEVRGGYRRDDGPHVYLLRKAGKLHLLKTHWADAAAVAGSMFGIDITQKTHLVGAMSRKPSQATVRALERVAAGEPPYRAALAEGVSPSTVYRALARKRKIDLENK